MNSIYYNKTWSNDPCGHNRYMYTPWHIKIHDVCKHDEHKHVWYVVHEVVVVCENDDVSVKHEVSLEFVSLKK